MSNTPQPHIIPLPKIADGRGNLSIIEQLQQIPFAISRVYWIYDVPGGCNRGEHAYKQNQEFIVALSGSFDVELDDGTHRITYSLNRSYQGVFVPAGTWRRMTNFSTNSLALVLASLPFNANDYILNYSEFVLWKLGIISHTNSPNVPSPCSNGTPLVTVQSLALQQRLPTVFDCALCQLPRHHDPEGNLTFVYQEQHIPFAVQRVFYSYDIPGGEARGAHAHKQCHQFIIAASGSFEVVLNDGHNQRTVMLNRPFWGLHVPPGVWASEQNFSSGSICLVLASHPYVESDYLRNFTDFLRYRATITPTPLNHD